MNPDGSTGESAIIKIPTRILIVSRWAFVEMLALRLEAAGETVFRAHSGEAGLVQLQTNPNLHFIMALQILVNVTEIE
jgi:hypothetical protein